MCSSDLDLSSNKLGDRGAKALLVPDVLSRVEELRLGRNGITEGMVSELHARYGDALVIEEAPVTKGAKKAGATKRPAAGRR